MIFSTRSAGTTSRKSRLRDTRVSVSGARNSLQRRLMAGLAALPLALAGAVLTGAGAASADTPPVACAAGSQSSTYNPGLRLVLPPPPDVHVHTEGNLGVCVAPDLVHTAGTFELDGTGPLSCLSGGSGGTGRIDWAAPGTHASHFTYTGLIVLRPDGVSVITETGEITSGDYAGHTLVMAKVVASVNLLACATPQGLTQTSGPVNVLIL